MFKILIPCYGDKSKNLEDLLTSIDSQVIDSNVECFFLEDEISESFKSKIKSICSADKFLVENNYGKRLYGLFNICRFLDSFDFSQEENDPIIGIIDCDDQLWGNDCFSNIKDQYELGFDCVWTANELKGLGVNFSAPLTENADVYSHPWVSSHFKTFKLSDYKNVPKSNFKGEDGNYFRACYDQALMLPILHNIVKRGGKTKFIDKVHYIYNGNLNPDESSEYRKDQLYNEHYIRSRGYLNE
tara:strand:- start:878 stop:1606 length:729 start_codon:yes stop_codon:yes gene_type:complete